MELHINYFMKNKKSLSELIASLPKPILAKSFDWKKEYIKGMIKKYKLQSPKHP